MCPALLHILSSFILTATSYVHNILPIPPKLLLFGSHYLIPRLTVKLHRAPQLHMINIWDWIILCCGRLSCAFVIGCLVTSLTSTHQLWQSKCPPTLPGTLGWGEGAEAELTPGEKLGATVINTVRCWEMADTGQCNRKGPINTARHKPPWQFTGDKTVFSTDIYIYVP